MFTLIIYVFNIFPTVVTEGGVYILDLAAKLDQCAEYICKQTWGEIDYPPPFGREAYPEVYNFNFLPVNTFTNIINYCKVWIVSPLPKVSPPRK